MTGWWRNRCKRKWVFSTVICCYQASIWMNFPAWFTLQEIPTIYSILRQESVQSWFKEALVHVRNGRQFSSLPKSALPRPRREDEGWKNGERRESSLMGSEWILDDVIYSQRSSTVAPTDLDPPWPTERTPHRALIFWKFLRKKNLLGVPNLL